QLIAPAGSYDITISGYTCGSPTPALSMRARWWDHDMTEPLPEEVSGQNPFSNGSVLAASAVADCSQTMSVQSEELKPNRLYFMVQSEGLRTTLPGERLNLRNDFKITVTRK